MVAYESYKDHPRHHLQNLKVQVTMPYFKSEYGLQFGEGKYARLELVTLKITFCAPFTFLFDNQRRLELFVAK